MLHKSISFEAAEIKATGKKGKFAGYASKFNGNDAYGDTILKGAYANTLKNRERPIQMRWNHFGEVIGKWTKCVEDDIGLWVEGELTPGHSKAEDVYASMMHGAVDGMSIGFRIKEAEIKMNEDGEECGRILKEIELVEISVVESPADLGAKVESCKSHVEEATTLKELEDLLRDAGGFSKNVATAIIAKARSIGRSDSVQAVGNDEKWLSDAAIIIATKNFK